MIKTALALFPFMEDLKTDLRGTLQKIKNIGYEGVEFAYGFHYDPNQLREALKETGLELVGWHIDRTYIYEEFFEVVIHYMKTAGNQRLIIPWVPDSYTESEESWEHTAEEFNQLANKLRQHGISLGYHNHTKEFERKGTAYLFDTFCQNTDPEIFIQLDVGNMLSAGASPEEFLTRYKGRFQTIHIKPYSLVTGFCTMIGQDSINYPQLLANCKDAGTDWLIVEYEDSGLFGKYQGAEECRKQLMAFQK